MRIIFVIITILLVINITACSEEKLSSNPVSIGKDGPATKKIGCSAHGRTAMTKERTKKMLCD